MKIQAYPQYCSYELLKKLEESDIIITDFYGNEPTLYMVLQSLYRAYGLFIVVIPTISCYYTYKLLNVSHDNIETPPYNNVCGEDFLSPEKAYEAGIIEFLKIKNEYENRE